MLTPIIKGKPSVQQSGIERNTAMSSFPAFLRGIGRDNAKSIKAVQLPIKITISQLYSDLFEDLIHQHIPDLAHLAIDWDPARCYRDVWSLPVESSPDSFSYLGEINIFYDMRTLLLDLPIIKRLTFVDGLSEFNHMGEIVLDKKNHRLEDSKAIWTSIVERSRESRRKLGSPCMCRYRECFV